LKQKVSKIIIGGSIESMIYAWRTQTKILVKEKEYVFRFDEKFSTTVFPEFNCENGKHLSANLIFALSFTGLMPYSGNIESIRETDGALKVITKGNKKIEIEFEELIRFDNFGESYMVYDFFNTRSMTPTKLSHLIDTESNFVSQLNLYKSPRVDDGKTKDIVVSSRMSRKDLLSPDYGQGIALIKVHRMLKSAGIRGTFAWERKGKRYYKKPKLEFHKRIPSRVVKPAILFSEVYNMKQEEGAEWKILETLRKKAET